LFVTNTTAIHNFGYGLHTLTALLSAFYSSDIVFFDELMKRAMMEKLSNIVKLRRLTLAGHIRQLPSARLASVAMQWVPDGGKRRRGRPSKTC